MRPKLVTLALALAIGGAVACAWSNQRVQLRPTIPFAPSDIARGRAVDLKVADERPRTVIGHRIGPGVGGAITTDQDLAPLVRDVIADALHRYGFTLAASGATGAAILNVELRDFEYEVTRDGFSVSFHAWAALEASCQSASRGYEKFYRDHRVRPRRSFRLTPERNTVLLNEAFSGVVRQPLADRDLLECLARSEGTPHPPDHTP